MYGDAAVQPCRGMLRRRDGFESEPAILHRGAVTMHYGTDRSRSGAHERCVASVERSLRSNSGRRQGWAWPAEDRRPSRPARPGQKFLFCIFGIYVSNYAVIHRSKVPARNLISAGPAGQRTSSWESSRPYPAEDRKSVV